MTLSERNNFFKAGIVICAVFTLLILAVSFFTIPHYQSLSHEEAARRPAGVFHYLSGQLLNSDYIAVHFSVAGLAVFSLTVMILIYHFFERTSAPEILYVAIFTISFSFEVIRLILPLHLIYNFASVYVRFAAQILLFIRFFGIFALFAASICAAGLDVQKIRYVILAIITAALIITINVPVDVLNWDTSLNMITGYNSMFRLIELVVFVTTAVSFLITAKIKDSKEYVYVTLGITLAWIGRNILLGTDNWIGPLPGALLLSFGIWFLCSKLHKIYLWM